MNEMDIACSLLEKHSHWCPRGSWHLFMTISHHPKLVYVKSTYQGAASGYGFSLKLIHIKLEIHSNYLLINVLIN